MIITEHCNRCGTPVDTVFNSQYEDWVNDEEAPSNPLTRMCKYNYNRCTGKFCDNCIEDHIKTCDKRPYSPPTL